MHTHRSLLRPFDYYGKCSEFSKVISIRCYVCDLLQVSILVFAAIAVIAHRITHGPTNRTICFVFERLPHMRCVSVCSRCILDTLLSISTCTKQIKWARFNIYKTKRNERKKNRSSQLKYELQMLVTRNTHFSRPFIFGLQKCHEHKNHFSKRTTWNIIPAKLNLIPCQT